MEIWQISKKKKKKKKKKIVICFRVTKAGANKEKGWPDWGYAISKLGVVVLTRIQAEEVTKDQSRKDILINTVSTLFGLSKINSLIC